MNACEAREQVYYLLGLAKHVRLLQKLGVELVQAQERYEQTGQAARVFTEFAYRTRERWSRSRRVIAKAEHLAQGPNPRFVVTNLPRTYADAQTLYEQRYCARGDMENRIQEPQLDLFADRTSTHRMRPNQLRLWFSSLAYVLASGLRRVAWKGTRMAHATCGTIRLHLFKIGALVTVTVRRVVVRLASACPYQDVFHQAHQHLRNLPRRC